MPSVKVYKMDGSVAGEMQLSDKIFNAEYNEPLIHQAVVTRLLILAGRGLDEFGWHILAHSLAQPFHHREGGKAQTVHRGGLLVRHGGVELVGGVEGVLQKTDDTGLGRHGGDLLNVLFLLYRFSRGLSVKKRDRLCPEQVRKK